MQLQKLYSVKQARPDKVAFNLLPLYRFQRCAAAPSAESEPLRQPACIIMFMSSSWPPEVARLPEVRAANSRRDPSKPCLYVGMSGLTPSERFQNHKNGIKASRAVQLYGIRLLPELYEMYNPMPFEAAQVMERDLAEDLRSQGYTVAGGH
jgi:hypothetical protein